jgi:hypothetical protein
MRRISGTLDSSLKCLIDASATNLLFANLGCQIGEEPSIHGSSRIVYGGCDGGTSGEVKVINQVESAVICCKAIGIVRK